MSYAFAGSSLARAKTSDSSSAFLWPLNPFDTLAWTSHAGSTLFGATLVHALRRFSVTSLELTCPISSDGVRPLSVPSIVSPYNWVDGKLL